MSSKRHIHAPSKPPYAGEQRRDRRFQPGDRRFKRGYARLMVGSRSRLSIAACMRSTLTLWS